MNTISNILLSSTRSRKLHKHNAATEIGPWILFRTSIQFFFCSFFDVMKSCWVWFTFNTDRLHKMPYDCILHMIEDDSDCCLVVVNHLASSIGSLLTEMTIIFNAYSFIRRWKMLQILSARQSIVFVFLYFHFIAICVDKATNKC